MVLIFAVAAVLGVGVKLNSAAAAVALPGNRLGLVQPCVDELLHRPSFGGPTRSEEAGHVGVVRFEPFEAGAAGAAAGERELRDELNLARVRERAAGLPTQQPAQRLKGVVLAIGARNDALRYQDSGERCHGGCRVRPGGRTAVERVGEGLRPNAERRDGVRDAQQHLHDSCEPAALAVVPDARPEPRQRPDRLRRRRRRRGQRGATTGRIGQLPLRRIEEGEGIPVDEAPVDVW